MRNRHAPMIGHQRVSKLSVNYGPSTNAETVCGNCAHFQEPNCCERVSGPINKRAWCELWERKREFPPKAQSGTQ